MEIRFSSLAQAKAVYDLIEHRVVTLPADAVLPEEEILEVLDLVAFQLRLERLIEKEEEK